MFVLFVFCAPLNAVAQQADDVVLGQQISRIARFNGAITIRTEEPMMNPDNCEIPGDYLIALDGVTRFTFDSGAVPAQMTFEELALLRINEVPVDFRLEGCIRGFPAVRWLAF